MSKGLEPELTFLLTKALWGANVRPAEALTMAREAMAMMEAAGEQENAQEVAGWLRGKRAK